MSATEGSMTDNIPGLSIVNVCIHCAAYMREGLTTTT